MEAIRLTSCFVYRCFCYHVVNCHDDPGYPNRVVVDVCKADATNALGMAKGFEGGVSGYGEDVSFFNENAVGVSDYGSAGKYK
jgi:carotenoid cleavage dioxygenase|tara:strand:- start:510 stop:758 length:249 start_codon:yes stop_codon:yes gene_type:complete